MVYIDFYSYYLKMGTLTDDAHAQMFAGCRYYVSVPFRER